MVPQTETASASTNLENGDQQLRLSPIGAPLAFQNFVRVGNEWKPATLPGIPLVTGASFPLVTSRLRRDGLTVACEGKATAESLDGKRLGYDWNAEISAVDGGRGEPWFRFRTTLHLPAAVRLRQEGQV